MLILDTLWFYLKKNLIMNFDPFVLPFVIGIVFLLVVLVWRYFKWLDELEISDRYKFFKGLFSVNFLKAVKDVFTESLLHTRIFKVNFFLGFMHMSFAFFWFLLIVVGSFESKLFARYPFNAPYDPVFFKFFNHDTSSLASHKYFAFFMDLFLLMILIALLLAIFKKFYSYFFGMKKTTRHRFLDRLARTFLWLIFPLRWLAESSTVGLYQNGGFFTNASGKFFASFLPLNIIEYPLWWLYSAALGAFFIILPFSRYMHIPTEIVLIFLKHFGIKNKDQIKGYANFEIQSCSSCGICIDACQMSSAADMNSQQAVYYLQKLKFKKNNEEAIFNCLMCLRCNQFCPVGIDIAHLRNIKRNELMPKLQTNYSYLDNFEFNLNNPNAKVLYFAGCMGHLRPGTIKSMINIFEASEVDYEFIDKDGSVCCGRPLISLGAIDEAEALINKNSEIFNKYNSGVLVTSCPICLKMFKEKYDLKIHVVHHTEFFKMLVDSKRIKLKKLNKNVVYHDPCELSRGVSEYKSSRYVLKKISNLKEPAFRKKKSVCCGGSLSNLRIRSDQRLKITKEAYNLLNAKKPDLLITSCPLCEQTFRRVADMPVLDIAEMLEKGIVEN